MTTKRPQNSILVLATLGVYLGLLLAGATPQVLAQAAMTRHFDVKDEIEVKDDLDNKPEPTKQDYEHAIESYSKRVGEFVGNLRKLHSIEEFTSSWSYFDSEKVVFSPCPETGTLRGRERSGHIDRWLVPVIIEANFIAEEFTWLADCLPSNEFPTRQKASSAGIKLNYEKADLSHELSIRFDGPERAKSRYAGLLEAFEKFEVEKDSKFEINNVLFKHTSLTVSGDQVFIITRLPRAGLDALLAIDAK